MATMWAIWLHRNEIVFRGVEPSTQRVMDCANEWVKRQETTNQLQTKEREKQTNQEGCKINDALAWTQGCIRHGALECFQVDGSWKKNTQIQNEWLAAIAWADDHNSNRWEAKKVLAISPVQTEAIAILHCIKSLGPSTKAISIKSYCIEVIRALADQTDPPLEIKNIVSKIKEEAGKLEFISIVKSKRDEVARAHFLANKARKE